MTEFKGVTPQSVEEWKPVSGWEEFYLVSNWGRVKRRHREVEYSDGRRYVYPEKILKTTNSRKYKKVELKAQGKTQPKLVHRLVAEAFLPNPGGLPHVLHWNDEGRDNRIENLRWGTQQDNMGDLARNKGHHNSIKTHCKRGHEFSEENTRTTPKGHRLCRKCKNLNEKDRVERIKGTEPPEHGTTNGYYSYGCRCDLCKRASSGYEKKKRDKTRDRINQKKREWYHKNKPC